MSSFPVHTLESAPADSRPVLEELLGAFGSIPNIAGVMAGSPVLIQAFIGVFRRVHAGSFDERQIQVVLLTDAVTNASAWAVAFHTALALDAGVAIADVRAIRARRSPEDPPLAALSRLAKTLIETRGHLVDAEVDAFVQAGFSAAHLLEVITIVAASTITNYVGSVGRPPLEPAFEAHAWVA